MSDSYQAIYDAVRSRIGSVDVSAAIVEATRGSFDISHAVNMVKGEIDGVIYDWQAAVRETLRPFMQLKPRMFPDGDQWCALYGENLQDGVAGFGDTPAQASIQFDIEWLNAKAGPFSLKKGDSK